MNINTILEPALFIMNKLSFKAKIIVSISILFILLLIPSSTLFKDHIQKKNIYDNRLIGLEYIEVLNKITRNIQTHLTITNQYLDGDTNCSEDLIENESQYKHQHDGLRNYDHQYFNILSSNGDFQKGLAYYQFIKLEKLQPKTKKEEIRKLHQKMIDKFIQTMLKISKYSSFSSSKDLRINYLGNMLEEKLPRLYNITQQLLVIPKQKRLQEKLLFKLATNLSSLQRDLDDNLILNDLENFGGLVNQMKNVTYSIDTILQSIEKSKNLINNEPFFEKVRQAIQAQDDLYIKFNFTYSETVRQLQTQLNGKIWSLIFGFLTILFVAFYIFMAFYDSITSNIKKLTTASELISSGQTKIKLEVEKKDEIGNALLAFNTMSEKLTENISFLDGYKTAIDNSSIVSKTDTKGIITYVNQMFCDVSGFTREELIGHSHNIIRHQDMNPRIFENMWETIQEKKIWKGTLKNKDKQGNAYIVKATILPILDSNENIIEYVAVRHDITELEKSKEEIKKQRTDLLTGLPNRNQLLFDLKSAVKPIIFYLNIDNFSGFNDFYGSDMGDSVLIHFAKILEALKENKHFELYKLSSDQFILLFQEGYLANSNFQDFFMSLIEEIEEQIASINLENQNSISISVTAGAATYYTHDNYQKLILYSNIARKKAQKEHKKFLIFNHSMTKSENYAENIEWIKKIKEALATDRIVTYYQPILDNNTGEVVKYETLVRMLDENNHPVSTLTFLEVAQKAKLYPEVTKIVIEKALETFKDLPSYEFSINLTIEDILSKDIKEYILEKLAAYPNSQNIIFEITESEKVDDYKIINDFIESVKEFGVKIAIDDFGSGYANFEHIIGIDADFIKIDGTLIKNLDSDKNARIITEAIISFSRKLGKKTITEYVHSEEIYKLVKELGADYSQGFYFGAPSPYVN